MKDIALAIINKLNWKILGVITLGILIGVGAIKFEQVTGALKHIPGLG